MAEFTPPAWAAPFDADAYIDTIPSHCRVRGLFFQNLIELLRDTGVEPSSQSYVPFQSYPGADYNRLLIDVARARHPGVPIRQSLRRLGHTIYGTFLDSTIGRVLFAFAGRDPRAALRLAPRAYDIASGGTIKASVVHDGSHHSVLRLENVWTFPTCHEVGVVEGALQTFESSALLEIAERSPCDVDFRLIWR